MDNDHNEGNPLSVCVLASGSKGNCIHIAAGDNAILIDVGLSGREIERRMQRRGLATDALKAIVVSHEHIDHVRGVGVMARRYNLPVFMSNATAAALHPAIGKIPRPAYFKAGIPFSISPFSIHPFNVSHDAVDPVGFTVSMNGCRIGIATDLGIATGLVEQHLSGCQFLIIEANHDLDMLHNGPYPWPLKQRIKSRNGHLSNEAAVSLLCAVMNDNLRYVVFGHMSETNNTSAKVLERVLPAIGRHAVHIAVAQQDRSSSILML